MLVTRTVLIISTFIINIILLKGFELDTLLAGILTVTIVLLGYIIYANYKQRKRYKLLEEDLDPEAFIEATKKQLKIVGKNKRSKTILNADLIVGLLSLRKNEETLDILNETNVNYLSKWNGSQLIYYGNEMSLYYNMGEADKAKEIYEAKIRNYPIKLLNESLNMDLILANKSLHEKEYNTSKELYNKVLQNNKSKRVKVEIYYTFAHIAEEEGNIEEAIKKYKIVADKGNKLYSAYLAKEKIKTLSI